MVEVVRLWIREHYFIYNLYVTVSVRIRKETRFYVCNNNNIGHNIAG